MRVLIGCEESGAVRDAFNERGHLAVSCDLVPTRSTKPGLHITGDVTQAIRLGSWDIIILHPPCTAMALSGNRWYGRGMPRHNERAEAIEWTMNLWRTACLYARVGVALENPTGVLFRHLSAPVQYVQPYEFGHRETKRTGFALNRLPALRPTSDLRAETMALPAHERGRVWYMAPGPNRQRDRSATYPGIASAMADQWGSL